MLFVLINLYNRQKKIRASVTTYLISLIILIGISFSTNYLFENFLEQRHRDRINLIIGKEVDDRGIGYNTNQSKIAISNGGLFGAGFLEGTQTKGNFVPRQHTDYIFSTIGEEWGFIGSILLVCLYMFIIIRVFIVAERQRSQFNRIYAYSVGMFFFYHFAVNIGMNIGFAPVIGIPLPFFSYGGSSMLSFSIMVFILLKLDSQRRHVLR